MLFKRKKEEFLEDTNDVLIVFDSDTLTSDIQHITDIDEESVTVRGMYKVPYADCIITNSQGGRNFFYKAPAQSVEETRRLAHLEKSIVLKQITQYKPSAPEGGADFTKIALVGLVGLSILMFGLGSCSGGL